MKSNEEIFFKSFCVISRTKYERLLSYFTTHILGIRKPHSPESSMTDVQI